jgi:hypothetical protein
MALGAPALAVSTRVGPQWSLMKEENLRRLMLASDRARQSEVAYLPVLIRIHSRFISRSVFGSWALMT